MEVNTCDTCRMPIEGKSVFALGKNYHPDHFLCCVCKEPITEATFHQRDGQPLCSKDYAASCPTCAQCSLPITDKIVTALGHSYHEAHFACSMCAGPMGSLEFHEKDGGVICNDCFCGKVADRCKACGEPIQANVTVALEAKWHPDCFKCAKCLKAITSSTFRVDESGDPYCETC